MANPDVVWKGNPVLESLLVPIGSLTPDPANARLHPARNLEAIRGSLARFGQQKPVVIDDSGIVHAGNGTLAAAKALGWTHLAAVRSDLSGVELTMYGIADNRTSDMAEWDERVLAAVLDGLREEDDWEPEAVGFTEEEIAELSRRVNTDPIADFGEEPADDDARMPNNVILLFGYYRFLVARDDYLRWNEEVTGAVGLAVADIEREIRRRLGLP
jgi:hypothetical protein